MVERGLTDNCGCVKARRFKEYLLGEQGDVARQKARESRKMKQTTHPKPPTTVKAKVSSPKKVNLSRHDPEHRRWMQQVLQGKAQREAMMARV
jgi:hypothetical protein